MAVCCVAMLTSAGCSRQWFRDSADREVYAIIKARSPEVAGMLEGFTIDQTDQDLLMDCPSAELVDVIAIFGEPIEGLENVPGDVNRVVVLTLEKSLAIASLSSRSYQSQKEDVYLTALSLTLQRYMFDPQFFGFLGGDYTETDLGDTRTLSADSSFGFDMLLKTGARISVSLQSAITEFLKANDSTSSSSIGIAIVQPLLEGAGISVTEPLTQSERNVIYQIRDFVRFRRTFFVGVLSQFYGVVQTGQVLQNEIMNHEGLQDVLGREVALEEAGLSSSLQVDQVRQDELRAATSVLTTRQRYQDQVDRFKITLGLPAECPLILDPAELGALAEGGVVRVDLAQEEIQQIALENRLDLMTARDQVEDAERKVEVAADDLLPGLDLHASLNTQTDGPDGIFDFSAGNTDASIGFELDLPLDKLRERNAYRSRLISLERAKRNYQDLRDRVLQEVRDDFRRYLRASSTYQIQVESVVLAESRVESSLLMRQAGRAIPRDVLEAQESLVATQNRMAEDLVSYKVASLELAQDMGILVVGDEGQLEENYDEYR